MRLLVLGGTEFVGRALAEDGVARGWDVTVFNRGTRPAPDGARALRGDRLDPDDGPAALADGEWDIVADTWIGAPRAVRETARLLEPRAGRYVYVSSRSVYAPPPVAGMNEDSPVVEASPDAEADTYPVDKRGGELAALREFGDRALLARAGIVLGPHENIGRLPWWLRRMERGGPVLAPGPRDLPMQWIDARDLAAWCLDAAERGLGGAYDTVSASGHTTTEEFLEACRAAVDSDAELLWAEPETVLAADIAPFTELPMWIPPGESHDMLYRSDTGRALAAGLRCRPIEETVADTLAWLRGLPADADPLGIPHAASSGVRRPGVPAEKEEAALRAVRGGK
ncbi:NAD-dependent epimerase/dehydratase family protein [Streptomyces alkaliphilus]|uniref:NAD-dependent epimerase/dehydratase family protein n=1 Tax=Streptomyces alkaliphilus TaxID=1472722 RepID=UPI00117D30E2|nr:NAD-dependent epimerase/dehydratase family protein [Streptomyces alkaliphilus]MQS08109.1 NAD-dependent epimerase/dehydratase family protein [Streptomyces alkaliphilus]